MSAAPEEIATHRGARALVASVLARARPAAEVQDHDYDAARPQGRMRIRWWDAGNQHLAVIRYELPTTDRALRRQAAELRDGQSYPHLE